MRSLSVVFVICLSIFTDARAEAPLSVPPLDSQAVHSPNVGRMGMVVAEEKIAAAAGAEILRKGGNAIDAAVATGFALAVTHPSAGNLGGGGFMLYHLTEQDQTVALDYRETAPAAATRDLFLDENGNVDNQIARFSHKSSGIPGTVAGLLFVHEKHGKLPLATVMAPAINLAEKGYRYPYYAAASVETYRSRLINNAAAKAMFYKPDGSGYLPGETVRRPQLAKVLSTIARKGRDGFYKGWVARAIATEMASNDGLITLEDLANYQPVERQAVRGTYRGVEIASFPPPSSGVHLIEMLNMLETRPPHQSSGESAESAHFLAEVMRRAYADRASLLGDTGFVDIPLDGLLSKEYARERIADFDPAKASPSSTISSGDPAPFESPDTTNFVVIDKDGNVVSNTYTINLSYGSGIVIPGTEILMNNEMDDFVSAPGKPNYYGLVGSDRNAIEPGKRPASSMVPTILFKDGEPWMAVGAPGGSRIITAVLNVILNVIDRGMNIADAIDEPRIHHQWLPDQILYEPGLSDETKAALEQKGHKLMPFNFYARPTGAIREDGWIYGYADPRTPGGGACTADVGC